MSKMTAYQPGLFSWVDLMAHDTAKAKSFYAELFGWAAEDMPADAGTYTQFRVGDASVAGMGEMAAETKHAGTPAHWNSYVTVEDADATVVRIAELGGDVMMPVMQVMTAGRMAVVSDPTGAGFSIWEPGEHVGSAIVNEPVSLCWNELVTTNVETAKAFYADTFGWDYVDHDMPMGTYTEIRNRDRPNGGIMARPPQMGDTPPHWGVYFAVDDCDDTVARARALGGRPLGEPMDIEAGRFCPLVDDQGAAFAVMRLAS